MTISEAITNCIGSTSKDGSWQLVLRHFDNTEPLMALQDGYGDGRGWMTLGCLRWVISRLVVSFVEQERMQWAQAFSAAGYAIPSPRDAVTFFQAFKKDVPDGTKSD